MEKVTDDRLTITSLRNRVFEEFRYICEEYEIDIKSITPLQFGFVLGEINNRIIKPNESYLIFNQEHEYNSKNLYAMYKYILSPLCSLYNQLTNEIYFCLLFDIELINLDYIYIIYADLRRTTFREILRASESIGLKSLLTERRSNPVGVLAILNKQYGWSENDNVRQGQTTQEISVQSLPQIEQKD
jgi:hypothetical protein